MKAEFAHCILKTDSQLQKVWKQDIVFFPGGESTMMVEKTARPNAFFDVLLF